ncbi:MAG: phosphoglycolate phosphatase [Telmatospirillum sp.]|nr:phosphoglycolate phosphatase [Telmatospirillum sp.]
MTPLLSLPAGAAVLFDLDGTLVDSLPDLGWAMNEVLSELGRPPASAEDVRSWVGDGVSVLVERGLTATGGVPAKGAGTTLPTLVARFLELYGGHAAVDSRVYPDVLPTLTTLKAAGLRLGVCTNKPTSLSLLILRELGFGDLFSAVVGGDAIPNRKPHPDHLRATLTAMGGSGAEAVTGRPGAVMVGDSRNDVASARAAGLPVILVGFGYCQAPPATMGADAVIDRYTDLPESLSRLL